MGILSALSAETFAPTHPPHPFWRTTPRILRGAPDGAWTAAPPSGPVPIPIAVPWPPEAPAPTRLPALRAPCQGHRRAAALLTLQAWARSHYSVGVAMTLAIPRTAAALTAARCLVPFARVWFTRHIILPARHRRLTALAALHTAEQTDRHTIAQHEARGRSRILRRAREAVAQSFATRISALVDPDPRGLSLAAAAARTSAQFPLTNEPAHRRYIEILEHSARTSILRKFHATAPRPPPPPQDSPDAAHVAVLLEGLPVAMSSPDTAQCVVCRVCPLLSDLRGALAALAPQPPQGDPTLLSRVRDGLLVSALLAAATAAQRPRGANTHPSDSTFGPLGSLPTHTLLTLPTLLLARPGRRTPIIVPTPPPQGSGWALRPHSSIWGGTDADPKPTPSQTAWRHVILAATHGLRAVLRLDSHDLDPGLPTPIPEPRPPNPRTSQPHNPAATAHTPAISEARLALRHLRRAAAATYPQSPIHTHLSQCACGDDTPRPQGQHGQTHTPTHTTPSLLPAPSDALLLLASAHLHILLQAALIAAGPSPTDTQDGNAARTISTAACGRAAQWGAALLPLPPADRPSPDEAEAVMVRAYAQPDTHNPMAHVIRPSLHHGPGPLRTLDAALAPAFPLVFGAGPSECPHPVPVPVPYAHTIASLHARVGRALFQTAVASRVDAARAALWQSRMGGNLPRDAPPPLLLPSRMSPLRPLVDLALRALSVAVAVLHQAGGHPLTDELNAAVCTGRDNLRAWIAFTDHVTNELRASTDRRSPRGGGHTPSPAPSTMSQSPSLRLPPLHVRTPGPPRGLILASPSPSPRPPPHVAAAFSTNKPDNDNTLPISPISNFITRLKIEAGFW